MPQVNIDLALDQDVNTKIIEVTSYEDAIITISRSGNKKATWDKVHGVKDTTSFVRKDQIKKPSADYNLEEWIEFKNDSLKTDFNNFERHPHDPLLSEITNSAIESNMHLGTHNFGQVFCKRLRRTGRTVHPIDLELLYINKNYTHSGASLRADKLQLKTRKYYR